MQTEESNPRVIGQRLAEARKARGLTQEQAAEHLGCSRPTLIAIEKGVRQAKAEELAKLASHYGRSIHEIVRPGAEPVALVPHLRAVVEPTFAAREELNEAIGELQRFADDYRELERIVGAKPIGIRVPTVVLPKRGSLKDFAEDVAMRERERLGLGTQPVLRLRRVLESELGLRVFYWDLPSPVAGMFAHVAELGFCILINRKHPAERRRATLAHEYGHAVSPDRHRPGIDYLNGNGRKPQNERFAEAFGLSFLMPASGIRRKFHEITASTGDFQVADLCRLSNYYFVGVQAMTLRLEELSLVARGAWDMLKEKGFRPRAAAEDLGLRPRGTRTTDPYPERYKYLAVQAFQMGKISEGQLCRFLRSDRVTARGIVAQCTSHRFVDECGEVREQCLPFEDSLLQH